MTKITNILLKSADSFRKFAEIFDISEVVDSVRMKNSIQSLAAIRGPREAALEPGLIRVVLDARLLGDLRDGREVRLLLRRLQHDLTISTWRPLWRLRTGLNQ